MKSKINAIIDYIKIARPNCMIEEILSHVETLNQTGHLLSEEQLSIEALIVWAYSQSNKVVILASSNSDKRILLGYLRALPKLTEYNSVSILVHSELTTCDERVTYFYMNLNDFRVQPIDTYVGTDISISYKWLSERLTVEVYNFLKANNYMNIDNASNLELTDKGILYLENILNADFNKKAYVYTYCVAYLMSRYVLKLNIDYEIINGDVCISGKYSKLQSSYTPTYQLITNFLYEKHKLLNLPMPINEIIADKRTILSGNIKGAYLNYSQPNQRRVYTKSEESKLEVVGKIIKAVKGRRFVIVCDSETFKLAQVIKSNFKTVKCEVVSTLLTIRDDSWCVIDITNYPTLIKSDYKLINRKIYGEGSERVYLSLVSSWNKRYKANSDLNYINTNVISRYRKLWYKKYNNTYNSLLYELESEYLIRAYNRYRKYKNIRDYGNTMYILMESLFNEMCEYIDSKTSNT